MYHLRLKGDHYQMGVKRGKIFQKNNIIFPLHLDNFQLEHGRKSEQILKEFFPEVCEEIRGWAAKRAQSDRPLTLSAIMECYAVEVDFSLIYAAFSAFSRQIKGFILTHSKMVFYCVTFLYEFSCPLNSKIV